MYTLGREACVLTHTYPQKPSKRIKVAICNQQADCPIFICKRRKEPYIILNVLTETRCHLNNPNKFNISIISPVPLCSECVCLFSQAPSSHGPADGESHAEGGAAATGVSEIKQTVEPVRKTTCVQRPPFQTTPKQNFCDLPVLRDYILWGHIFSVPWVVS